MGNNPPTIRLVADEFPAYVKLVLSIDLYIAYFTAPVTGDQFTVNDVGLILLILKLDTLLGVGGVKI